MAGFFLSCLDLAFLPDSLPALDAVVFIHAGEWDSLLMAFWVWCLYGLPGIILNSRKLLFSTFRMWVGSSRTRLSHAQSCESLYFLSAECHSPSDGGCDITAFFPFPPLLSEAGELGQYCTHFSLLTASLTLHFSHLPLPHMHLPWHFSHLPLTHSKTIGADEVTTRQLITC